MKKTAKNW